MTYVHVVKRVTYLLCVYAYGITIRVCMVRIIVPYAYGAYEIPLVYIVSSLRP